VAGGQRVDAPYVPYKNARAGRRGGERREKGGERVREEVAAERGEVGNGDRTLEKRRRSGWVRWRRPGYPGRSSAANRDKEGSGPWAGGPIDMPMDPRG
jgi:hypothetical protein